MKMQTTAKLNGLRVAPRKVRLIIDAVRGKEVEKALQSITGSKKHAADPVIKLIKSAVANAKHNHNIDEKSLIIQTAKVDGGKILYRWMPRAMGRATPIRKRTSHITIVLEGDVKEEVKKKETKKKVEKVSKEEEKKDVKETK